MVELIFIFLLCIYFLSHIKGVYTQRKVKILFVYRYSYHFNFRGIFRIVKLNSRCRTRLHGLELSLINYIMQVSRGQSASFLG